MRLPESLRRQFKRAAIPADAVRRILRAQRLEAVAAVGSLVERQFHRPIVRQVDDAPVRVGEILRRRPGTGAGIFTNATRPASRRRDEISSSRRAKGVRAANRRRQAVLPATRHMRLTKTARNGNVFFNFSIKIYYKFTSPIVVKKVTLRFCRRVIDWMLQIRQLPIIDQTLSVLLRHFDSIKTLRFGCGKRIAESRRPGKYAHPSHRPVRQCQRKIRSRKQSVIYQPAKVFVPWMTTFAPL